MLWFLLEHTFPFFLFSAGQSGWLYTRWGEIARSLKFKYLYKSHCKSCELLWAFKGCPII